jgi:hypothetical protein
MLQAFEVRNLQLQPDKLQKSPMHTLVHFKVNHASLFWQNCKLKAQERENISLILRIIIRMLQDVFKNYIKKDCKKE